MQYLITSANSYGNVGDDICGYSAEYLVRTIDTSAVTTVTCPPYEQGLVDATDCTIIGGGGVIYDTDMANVENYMRYVDRARETGKISVVWGVGVQGITTEEGKERYRCSLSGADIVTVRSPVDERLLKEIGIEKALATQDLGFLADEWVPAPGMLDRLKLSALFRSNAKPNLGLALVDLVAIKGDSFDEKSANFVDSLEANLARICRDFNVYLLVHSADDAVFYKSLKQRFDVRVVHYKSIKDLPYFWAAYQRLDLVIGVRFHSIILGLLAGKPVIGIGSESTKQNRLANYNMPTLRNQFLTFSNLDGIQELFSQLKQNFDAGTYVQATEQEMTHAKQRARQNGQLLGRLLARAKI